MKIYIPKNEAVIRDWEEEVAKGLKIDDILHMKPEIVATSFWKKDKHFEFLWFWDIEPHMNSGDLIRHPWFLNISPELKAWMKIPSPKPCKLLQRKGNVDELQFKIEL